MNGVGHGTLTKEDLFAFYAGEDVKARFKALELEAQK